MNSQATHIRDLFDRIAPVYDQFNTWLSLGQHRIWKQMAVSWSQPPIGSTCLDLCCGSGDLTQMLAEQVGPSGQVFGADFSAAQLAIARQRHPGMLHQANIIWLEADVLALPLEDQSFDAATMGYGLRNVTNILAALREIYRVLKPGATVSILDFHRPQNSPMLDFQQWYLEYAVVPLARQFGLTDEYAYISSSLAQFPVGAEQVDLARQAGFDAAIHYSIAGGMMGVLVATKPGRKHRIEPTSFCS
ncbi:MAG: bifunctional demethylmenaquinone methyltransferase/2-methoxy-6-polyprenyl-1,4-benzoquinol methylase UbiE [Cyanothece sp. SIO1E1]|nr:bifunctional demethylmenaquinone methyltransferase/2-methoxy-6-polyprenyl-1,4-benzoquinol methylase UbiE [Cyanothece sp. SIO1E1]